MTYKDCLGFSYGLNQLIISPGGDMMTLSLCPIELEEAGKIIVVSLFRNEVNKIYFSEKCLRKWFLNV